MESKKHEYKPVSSFDDLSSSSTNIDERTSEDFALESLHIRKRRWRWIPSPLLGSIISLNILIATLIIVALTRKPTDQQCSAQLSTFCKYLFPERWHTDLHGPAPALEAIEYIEYDFAAEFNSTNIYRGPPTPEREDAWWKLTYSRLSHNIIVHCNLRKHLTRPLEHAIEIPEDKIAGLNRTEADNLKHVPADVGTGYVAILEVFHQLHCLVCSTLIGFNIFDPTLTNPEPGAHVYLVPSWKVPWHPRRTCRE
jgi:hypothetical protein